MTGCGAAAPRSEARRLFECVGDRAVARRVRTRTNKHFACCAT